MSISILSSTFIDFLFLLFNSDVIVSSYLFFVFSKILIFLLCVKQASKNALKLLNKNASKRNNQPIKLSTVLKEIDQDDINEQNQIATGLALPGVTFQNRLMEFIT
jgi:hypothetical protein